MNGLFKEAAKAFPKLNPTERQTIKPGPAVDAIASISNYNQTPELDAPATPEKILMSINKLKRKIKSNGK